MNKSGRFLVKNQQKKLTLQKKLTFFAVKMYNVQRCKDGCRSVLPFARRR